MIQVNECGKNILGDVEVLKNITTYIRCNVGEQDWADHCDNVSGYIAAGIGWHEDEVMGYFRSCGMLADRREHSETR